MGMNSTFKLTKLHCYSYDQKGDTSWSGYIVGQVLIWNTGGQCHCCVATPLGGWVWIKGAGKTPPTELDLTLYEKLEQQKDSNDFSNIEVTIEGQNANSSVIINWRDTNVPLPPRSEEDKAAFNNLPNCGTF
jgi:hypothetical protein